MSSKSGLGSTSKSVGDNFGQGSRLGWWHANESPTLAPVCRVEVRVRFRFRFRFRSGSNSKVSVSTMTRI